MISDFVFFFFSSRRRHTRFDCDWSSDVCSSDLGCRVVVQGFGNVGSMAADLMQKAGYKIVGLADIGGGLYNEKGFDIPKVIDWRSEERRVGKECRSRWSPYH